MIPNGSKEVEFNLVDKNAMYVRTVSVFEHIARNQANKI